MLFHFDAVWDAWTSWTPCKYTRTGPQRRRFRDLKDNEWKLPSNCNNGGWEWQCGPSNGSNHRSDIDLFRRILPIVSNVTTGIGTSRQRITDIIENEFNPELPRLFQVEQCKGQDNIVPVLFLHCVTIIMLQNQTVLKLYFINL